MLEETKKLFYSDLTLREVEAETGYTIHEIRDLWKEIYGIKEYNKRTKRMFSNKGKRQWGNRDGKEKQKTLEKRNKAYLKYRIEQQNITNYLSQRILNNQKVDIRNKITFDIAQKSPDYVQCQLCGYIKKNLQFHLLFRHQLNQKAYSSLFPEYSTVCEASIKKQSISLFKGQKNKHITVNIEDYDIEKESKIRCYRRKMFKLVHKRDKTCQACSDSTRKLDVHHIVPKRLFHRYDLKQHDSKNLILLCDECHATIGQECDLLCLEIYTDYFKLAYPDDYKQVLEKMKLNEIIIPRRRGGRPGHNIDKAEILSYANDRGIVDLTVVETDVPLSKLREFCQGEHIPFIANVSVGKDVKTKICPMCGWSGAFQFNNHLMRTDDQGHRDFLERLKDEYREQGSAGKVAKLYVEYNITKALMKDLLRQIGVLRKLSKKSDVKCPVCDWKGNEGFGIHLSEMNDKVHEDLKVDILYKLDQGDSPIKIGREMGMTTAVIKGVIKKIYEVNTMSEIV